MDPSLIAQSKITINSTPEKIWEALTQAENIQKYLYGTQVDTDWNVGSPITFSGEYDGQTYMDKGNVLQNDLHKTLKYNYWSSFSGLEDTQENYSIVTYQIDPIDDEAYELSWHQQGFSSEEGQCHTQEGLASILEQIRAIAEK